MLVHKKKCKIYFCSKLDTYKKRVVKRHDLPVRKFSPPPVGTIKLRRQIGLKLDYGYLP